MQDIDDIALLRQYAGTGSEDAFSQLVGRHVNLVYSVALRQSGNPSQAEDITQAVFAILARKAANLGRGVIVAGWLYETTRLTTANSIRTEMRRARREQEACMQSLAHESEPEAWTQIAPLLDSAMDRLNQKERHAIVLRFFEGKSIREVGEAFGGTENAAKQKLQRALEKLRTFFARRKIVLTTAVIAGAVSAHSVQAAPAGLGAAAASAAAPGAASGSTLTLIKGALKIMVWTKLKTTVIIGGAALFAAGITTVTVKEVAHYSEDSVWSHITRIDSHQLDAAPPAISIRRAQFVNMGGSVTTGKKSMGAGASVLNMLSTAYHISEVRILNTTLLPSGKYDYLVTLPHNPSETLQAAISKKFGLKVKREMRETNVFLLKVATPDAPGLKPAARTHSGSSWSSNPGKFKFKNSPVASLAESLQFYLRLPVIDQTALTGNYDFTLQWSDPDSLKDALLNQLGLELTESTQSIEMLVVKK